jgi:signal transduction histidine kinase
VRTVLLKLKQVIPTWSVVLVAIVAAVFCIWLERTRTETTVRVGFRQFPPYLLEKPDGTPDGMAVAVLKEAAQRLGIHLVWSLQAEGPERALKEGKVDLWPLLATKWTDRNMIHVSRPLTAIEFVLLAPKSSGIMTEEQTVGKRVAFVDTPAFHDMVERYLKKILPVPRSDQAEVLRSICTAQADAAFLDSRFAQSFLMDRPTDCENIALRYTSIRPALVPLGIASSNKFSRTADLLANEVLRMGAEGSLARLQAQWSVIGTHDTEAFSVLAQLEDKSRYLSYVIVAMAVLMLALVILARRLHVARETASRVVKLKATLLTNVSHEVRAPMNGVLGMTNLLFTTDLTDEQREYAEAAHSSAESMLEMLNNMLDYARMDQGNLQFDNVDFDLHGLLEDVAEHFGPQAVRKHLELVCSIARETPQIVTGDPVKLRQVLSNLMSNAVKFTASGEIVLCARVVSEESGGVVLQIEVTDTGVGIADEDRTKLFRTFGQLDATETRSHSGAGLGLTICKQIIAGGGGYMDYHSKVGRGSSFWIVMRFGRPEYNLPPAKSHPEVAGRCVLIVSRSLALRNMVRDHCRSSQMNTTEAASVAAALELLRSTSFDLIIGDDCATDTHTLVAAKKAPARMILLASASNHVRGQNRLDAGPRESGVDEILLKPLRKSSLSYAIQDVLTRPAPETWYAHHTDVRDESTRS